jgi:hypothetical protein
MPCGSSVVILSSTSCTMPSGTRLFQLEMFERSDSYCTKDLELAKTEVIGKLAVRLEAESRRLPNVRHRKPIAQVPLSMLNSVALGLAFSF